jgi:hypothetical protein
MRLEDLRRNNRRAIHRAGPRSMPGQDSAAPNLQIAALTETFEAIGLTPGFKQRLGALHEDVSQHWFDLGANSRLRLRRPVYNPPRMLARVDERRGAVAPDVDVAADRLKSCVLAVRTLTNRHLERLRRDYPRSASLCSRSGPGTRTASRRWRMRFLVDNALSPVLATLLLPIFLTGAALDPNVERRGLA